MRQHSALNTFCFTTRVLLLKNDSNAVIAYSPLGLCAVAIFSVLVKTPNMYTYFSGLVECWVNILLAETQTINTVI